MTESSQIDALFEEERTYPPSPEFVAQANAGAEMYDRDPDEVWETEAPQRVSWFGPVPPFKQWDPPYGQWFRGGQLNVCYNCVDRHVEAGNGDRVAFHWEGEPADPRRDISYAQLQAEVTQFANTLRKLGVGKGTTVGIYMGMVPQLPVAMLACARLGAPHIVVFGGFSAGSLSDRLNDMGCEGLIT